MLENKKKPVFIGTQEGFEFKAGTKYHSTTLRTLLSESEHTLFLI